MGGRQISTYIHVCYVKSGPMEGNKRLIEVTESDIEYGAECEHCHEPLATVAEITAHIYRELTE